MKHYSIREAAVLCDVSVRTIREWIRTGKIDARKKKNGWYWEIPESEIMRIRYEHDDEY